MPEKTYTSTNANLHLTRPDRRERELVQGEVVFVNSKTQPIRFQAGTLITSDPAVQDFIESHPYYTGEGATKRIFDAPEAKEKRSARARAKAKQRAAELAGVQAPNEDRTGLSAKDESNLKVVAEVSTPQDAILYLHQNHGVSMDRFEEGDHELIVQIAEEEGVRFSNLGLASPQQEATGPDTAPPEGEPTVITGVKNKEMARSALEENGVDLDALEDDASKEEIIEYARQQGYEYAGYTL